MPLAFLKYLRLCYDVHIQYSTSPWPDLGADCSTDNRVLQKTLPRGRIKDIALVSGATGVCRYLLVMPQQKIKNWTQRWARCRSVWDILFLLVTRTQLLLRVRVGWRLTVMLLLQHLVLLHDTTSVGFNWSSSRSFLGWGWPEIHIQHFCSSSFENQDYHKKGREGSTQWPFYPCIPTTTHHAKQQQFWEHVFTVCSPFKGGKKPVFKN